MRYLFFLLLFAAQLPAQELEVQLLTPTPASLGSDTSLVAQQLETALASYHILTDDDADFALLPSLHFVRMKHTEATVTQSSISLRLDMELRHLPTGATVSATSVDLEASEFSPARAHHAALLAIRSTHPQLQAWAKGLPVVAERFLAGR